MDFWIFGYFQKDWFLDFWKIQKDWIFVFLEPPSPLFDDSMEDPDLTPSRTLVLEGVRSRSCIGVSQMWGGGSKKRKPNLFGRSQKNKNQSFWKCLFRHYQHLHRHHHHHHHPHHHHHHRHHQHHHPIKGVMLLVGVIMQGRPVSRPFTGRSRPSSDGVVWLA